MANIRTAQTVRRRFRRWWSRIGATSNALLAVGLQLGIGLGLMTLDTNAMWGGGVAVCFVIGALNLRSSVLFAGAGTATFFTALRVSEGHALAIPVLFACGLASWVVLQLISRSQNARRETYREPLVGAATARSGAAVFATSSLLALLIYGLTRLPALSGIAVPVAIVGAAAAVAGIGRVLGLARMASPTNEGFFRVGARLEAENMPRQIRLDSEPLHMQPRDD